MIEAGTRELRTLRVRATEFAAAVDHASAPGELLICTRESLRPGDALEIEISFGPLVDEILLTGTAIEADAQGRPGVNVRLDPGQDRKLDYVTAVLDGGREAAARRHRRLPSNIPVNWRVAGSTRSSRLRDISAGGAFILSREAPRVGDQIEVVLHPGPALPRVQVVSVVSWVHENGAHAGFGVNFKPADPGVARQLSAVVRRHESPAPA